MTRRLLLSLVFVVTAALVTSCGGGGGGGKTIGLDNLQGAYSGDWSRSFVNYQGTIQLQIASDGLLSGTVDHNLRGFGTVSGAIESDGDIELLFHHTVQGLPFISIMRGEFELSGENLRGTLEENVGDFDVPVLFELTRNSSFD